MFVSHQFMLRIKTSVEDLISCLSASQMIQFNQRFLSFTVGVKVS